MPMYAACAAWVALIGACAHLPGGGAHFSYKLDPSLGDSAKGEAALRDPSGRVITFRENQLVLLEDNDAAINAFLTRTHGKLLRRVDLDSVAPASRAGFIKMHLVEVDLGVIDDQEAAARMKSLPLHGRYRISSLKAVKLLAIQERERAAATRVSLNLFMRPAATQALEQPDGKGGFIDFAQKGSMTDVLDLPTGKLGIGVVRAWDYLRYHGIPFGPKPWTRPLIAIVDDGFALDESTGAPLNGNLDYEMGATPLQLSETYSGTSHRAGGPADYDVGDPHRWHGNTVFGVAAGFPYNRFGVAGTGAEVVKPIIIRTPDYSVFETTAAITNAAKMNASVINISEAMTGGEAVGYALDQLSMNMQSAINFARGYAFATVVVAAGNDGQTNNNTYDNIPCTYEGVLCVGGIDTAGRKRPESGFGSRVSIWAPFCMNSTWNPDVPAGAVGEDAIPVACGTSISAPFVAGVVGLMKALNPSLTFDDVRNILQATALPSPDPGVQPGYINAFAAVQAVRPNLPPTISIDIPTSGATTPYATPAFLASTVNDPELNGKVDGLNVQWLSNRDGLLCEGIACSSKPLSFGNHTITAVVRDPFGASASASTSVTAVALGPPTTTIEYPPTGTQYSDSQVVYLRGRAWNPTEALSGTQLTWSSNLTGTLGTGSELFTGLVAGAHHITLTGVDGAGQTASASVDLRVMAGAILPSIYVVQPKNGDSFGEGAMITLFGTAVDPDDGVLSGASMQWSSNIDGVLGTGQMLTVTLSGGGCAYSQHRLTLTATNSKGGQASMSIVVLVGKVC
jgi:serine protease